MALDLAIALAVIATRAVVAQLVRGVAPDTGDWAVVASDIAGAVVAGAASAPPQRVTQGHASAVREFDLYMASGRRYVRDLPDTWRTERDRLEMTRDARHEFVRAYSIAEQMNDTYRQAEAEVAIAGCWLWVPSLDDARKAMTSARQLLSGAKIFGSPRATQAYEDVVKLCQAYGAAPAGRPIAPLISQTRPTLAPQAPPTVKLEYGAWTQSGSVAIRFHTLRIPQAEYDAPEETTASGLVIPDTAKEKVWFNELYGYAGETVPLIVKNSRIEWISLMLTYEAIGVVLPSAKNTLPTEHRVAPGSQAEIFLERPERGTQFSRSAAIVFTLPR